jgi:hypothetical protein
MTILVNKMSCYAAVVVNLCAPRTQPPYFTFIPMRKLVFYYTSSELWEAFRNASLS